jgi:hypothetical protein
MRFMIVVDVTPEALRLTYLVLVALATLTVGPGALALLQAVQ